MNRLALLALAATLAAALPAQNQGITFVNGTDGFLEVPYSPQLVPATGITLEAWLTYDDTTLGPGWRWPTVCRQNITPQQEAYFLRVDAGQAASTVLRWKVVTSTGSVSVSWPFASGQLTAWTHVACTYDGRTAEMYVNGQLVGSAAGAGQPLFDRGGVLRIGKGDDSGGPIEVWNGSLDEVRLWPFARTAAEIQASMGQAITMLPGRVSTWNLDGNANDSSSNQHAQVQGTVAFGASAAPVVPVLAPPGILPLGTSGPGCQGPVEQTVRSLAQAGNAAFGLVALPSPAGSPLGVALLGLPASPPLPFLGMTVHVDPGVSVGVPVTHGPLGTASVGLGLPASFQPGMALASQFVFADPCGPSGLTASSAVTVFVLP